LAAAEAQQRREVYYSGWVQGVGFRYTARHLAGLHQVTGFVRNLPDGRVQLVVEGPPAEIERFLSAIREEMGHHIRDVDQRSAPANGEFGGFEVRR
jgi:acylphosphatase